MRLFGLAVLLAALSACAAQAPRQIVPTSPATAVAHAAVPFQAVAPAGYCLSDESDTLGAQAMRAVSKNLEPDDTLLGVFRPCDEPSSPSASVVVDRLALVASALQPASAEEAAIMDRRMFLTMMANPKVSALMSERAMYRTPNPSSREFRLDLGGFQYLGADDFGVYNGFALTPVEPAGPLRRSQAVLGMSMTGDHSLTAVGVSVGVGAEPHGRKLLQQAISDLLRGTIVAAERPARARPATPERPAPGMPAPASPTAPAGTGLTT
ncbi:hypothetical protein QFZ27_002601 [Inquilinus ginsengisoli]|jgi:hypothetical protein|uniref:hypothetical protein n=1 Tax=Inquilinus ginsengisoli TaxID=363840 RepID=UPI003D24982A